MADQIRPSHPGNPETHPPENDLTVDLTLEEFGEGDDLQALADEIADYDPDISKPAPSETSGMSREDLEAELAKVRAHLDTVLKAESDHKDKHHRLMADFANHRNRVGRETQLAVTLAEKKLLLELLPVVDNFERCLASDYSNVEDFHNGIGLIYKQLLESLRKAGVTGLDVKVGDPFDAMHAEALSTLTQPGLPDGAVAVVYERGYMLRDHLLRPARVIVNHVPPEAEDGSARE